MEVKRAQKCSNVIFRNRQGFARFFVLRRSEGHCCKVSDEAA
ncbi:hypothetical protein HMPREF1597_02273, partial [Escherichia coli 907701]